MSIPRTSTQRRPSHPGLFIKEFILDEVPVSQKDLAEALGLSRRTINQLVNEKRKISLDIALRLGRFTKTSPELWLNMQRSIDLWDAHHTKNESLDSIMPHEYYDNAVSCSEPDQTHLLEGHHN